jgi:CheY-like chemotaxis protein
VPIPGDPTRLQQVLVNLVTNASEAIGAGPGTITISTGTRDVDEGTPADTFPGDSLAPGRYAVLRVRDDGCGIDDETRARLFDPFFTTKYAGRGLGLASVLGIVRGHHGVLRVDSAPGDGASFEVMLPLVSDLPLAQDVEEIEIVPVARGGPRVALVVDDEPIVREISERMLQHLGFSVLSEEDGLAAIRTFEQRRHSITLVFLDMTMPRLGGEATVRRLRDVRPDVPILLASGYASDSERLAFMRDFSNIGFLHKPFDLHQLEQAVEALLAGSE